MIVQSLSARRKKHARVPVMPACDEIDGYEAVFNDAKRATHSHDDTEGPH